MERRQRDAERDRLSAAGKSGRAVVIEPDLKSARGDLRSPQARLEEAVGLTRAIDLDVIEQGVVTLSEIRPATYIGKGKVDEIAGLVKSA